VPSTPTESPRAAAACIPSRVNKTPSTMHANSENRFATRFEAMARRLLKLLQISLLAQSRAFVIHRN
jgi:hypothetical protein